MQEGANLKMSSRIYSRIYTQSVRDKEESRAAREKRVLLLRFWNLTLTVVVSTDFFFFCSSLGQMKEDVYVAVLLRRLQTCL